MPDVAATLERALIDNLDADCLAAVGAFTAAARRLGLEAASMATPTQNPWLGARKAPKPWTPWNDDDLVSVEMLRVGNWAQAEVVWEARWLAEDAGFAEGRGAAAQSWSHQ